MSANGIKHLCAGQYALLRKSPQVARCVSDCVGCLRSKLGHKLPVVKFPEAIEGGLTVARTLPSGSLVTQSERLSRCATTVRCCIKCGSSEGERTQINEYHAIRAVRFVTDWGSPLVLSGTSLSCERATRILTREKFHSNPTSLSQPATEHERPCVR